MLKLISLVSLYFFPVCGSQETKITHTSCVIFLLAARCGDDLCAYTRQAGTQAPAYSYHFLILQGLTLTIISPQILCGYGFRDNLLSLIRSIRLDLEAKKERYRPWGKWQGSERTAASVNFQFNMEISCLWPNNPLPLMVHL